MVIPGHGRLSDIGDVINYREMVTIVRDRVQDMIKKEHDARSGEGRQADARLRPALQHAGRVHHGDAFVEAVYRSLKK